MSIIIRRALPVIVVAVMAAAFVAGCGGSDSKKDPSTSAGNVTDRAFVNDMTPHHRSAIAMATVALARADHVEIKTLAANIISGQKRELTLMAGFKNTLSAGDGKSTLGRSMHAMGMDMNAAALKTAAPFDKAFIQMMSPHHAGAVAMARTELAKGKDPKVKALARQIIAAQTSEIAQMKAWLTKWYPGTSDSTGMGMG
ncbi:DUF305 domain-containing protein [Paraconexibacter antarcticus]|uniref:DUF305 domain-containing protein n=1 Tax=Paraconexibacter antarcticus TaxID=2949664 RepID=A0ABY5DQM3_9ACTN|nr:DUF305 domain-containing protein [Paraconexibacter antarcticus]UTI63971.1 DUF305 domain-containing protein [Paraconexibacter antarcticus]